MANTTSAKKAARQTARRTEINKAQRSRMRTEIGKVEDAITAGNKPQALAALRTAEPVLMRASQKGVAHKRAASRKVSRLVARVKAMSD